MSKLSKSRRRVFWGWVVETPSSGSNPKPNRNADADAPEAGARPRERIADHGTRKAVANVVTGNQVGAVGPPGGMAVGNERVEVEARVVVIRDRGRPQ